jgi:hypothetical protein
LRASIAASQVLVEGDRHFRCTASIGVATLAALPHRPAATDPESIPEHVLESLFATADR